MAEAREYAITVRKGKPPIAVAEGVMGPFIFVQYPYRKTRDMLIAMKGHNVHCFISDCDQDIEKTKRRSRHTAQRVIDHIVSHDRRRNRRA